MNMIAAKPPWLIIAAGVTLLALLASAQPINHLLAAGGMQGTNWYFNYELGYIHRGVMGSLFQLFYGAPDFATIHRYVPMWDGYALAAIVIISAAMMFYPILKLRVSGGGRALLMAFAAVLLLSPVWKNQAYHTASLDKYVFICALAALAALLWRRRVLMLAASALGLLIHPMMIFFAALIGALAFHALLFRPPWRRRQKAWLAAAVAPLFISLFLYAISAPEKNLALLEIYDYPDKIILRDFRMDFLHPGIYNREQIIGQLYTFPLHYLTLFIIFLIAPYCVACAVARLLRTSAVIPTAAANTSHNGRFSPAIKKLVNFFARRYAYLLFAAGIFVFLPVTLVHFDIGRILNWSQWGIMLVYIYLLSCANDDGDNAGDKNGEEAQRKKNGATAAATVALALAAYTFAGAPLVAIPPASPMVYRCTNFCIPGLTSSNPAGGFYSNAVFTAAKNSALPLDINGKTIWRYNTFTANRRVLSLGGNSILARAQQAEKIFTLPDFTLAEDEKIQIRLTYKASAAPPLKLAVWRGQQDATLIRQTETEAVWQFTSPATANFYAELYTTGAATLEVRRLSVEKI